MLYQAGLFRIRLQTAQAGAMMHQKIQQQLGIAGVVFGAGRKQRGAELRGGARVNRVDVQLFVLAEHENQGAARLLHRESDRLTAEASAQHCRPRRNRFRTMLDLAALAPIRVSRLQGPDVFTVAPVYGHIGSKAGFVSAINVHLALSSFGQALCSRERLIVESWLFRTASEHVVDGNKTAPAARDTASKHRVLARGTRSSGRPA